MSKNSELTDDHRLSEHDLESDNPDFEGLLPKFVELFSKGLVVLESVGFWHATFSRTRRLAGDISSLGIQI